ncbi:MAG: ABC transporter permease [Caldilinea sp. CFX5]|nr:ABC transporter permease [Caldilinea sp. CFX5]
MNGVRRIGRLAPAYLRTVARREWQLALLAVIGLAPGVAALVAWLNLAVALSATTERTPLAGWLLPGWLFQWLGAAGVLTGAGLVTLLIGCLGLTNAYLASIERRTPELTLLRNLGLRRRELWLFLAGEALAAGLLGSGVGIVLGLLLSWLSWPSAAAYFALAPTYTLAPQALITALGAGLGATLLFMHTAVRLGRFNAGHQHRPTPPTGAAGQRRDELSSLLGALYAGLLTWLVGFAILPASAALVLGGLAELFALLLTGGGWLLTRLYQRLPRSVAQPLWSLAIQGLARHPNQTAGMTLALTTGAYAVGMAGLSWLASAGQVRFPFWVALLVLIAGATLVFTVAALATWERRKTFAMLQALGAHRLHCWQLILVEYGIVALGGGAMGALMAFATWLIAGQPGNGWAAIGWLLVDLLGALGSAWVGAAPVLWMVARQPVGAAVRG